MVQDLTKISRLYLLSVCRQIRFILLQNRQGKTRLSRWYVSYNDDERKKIETETHRTIVSRDNKMTSFLEVSESWGWCPYPFLARPDQLINLFVLIAMILVMALIYCISKVISSVSEYKPGNDPVPNGRTDLQHSRFTDKCLNTLLRLT